MAEKRPSLFNSAVYRRFMAEHESSDVGLIKRAGDEQFLGSEEESIQNWDYKGELKKRNRNHNVKTKQSVTISK